MKLGYFKPWARWVIGLVALGFVIEAWLVARLFLDVPQWLFDWQTLIAGCLALFGALITVRFLNKQIVQTEQMELERRRREENAVKAVLPMALGEIVDYSIESIKLLAKVATPQGNRLLAPGGIATYPSDELPSIPTTAVETIQDCTRYANDDVARRLSTVLSTLQIHHARLQGIFEKDKRKFYVNKLEAMNLMIVSAELVAKASSLFVYGRVRSAELLARSSRKAIDAAFFQAGIVTEDNNELSDVLNTRYPKPKVAEASEE